MILLSEGHMCSRCPPPFQREGGQCPRNALPFRRSWWCGKLLKLKINVRLPVESFLPQTLAIRMSMLYI